MRPILRIRGELPLAVLVALFLIAGRWSFARVLQVDDLIFYQVRFWVALGLLVALLIPMRRKSSMTIALLPMLAFVVYFLVSALWAPRQQFALDKGLDMLLLAVPTLAIASLAQRVGPQQLSRNLWPVLAGVLGIFALLGLVVGLGTSGRVAVLGGGPNVFGRNMGLLALICVGTCLSGRARPAFVVGAIVAGTLVLLSGSRGALVATMLGLVALFFVQRVRLSRATVVIAGLVVVALVVANYTPIGEAALEAFEQRVMVLTLEQDYDSGRSVLYNDAFALGLRAPIHGAGLAAFEAEGLGVYPHNIVLEAFAEGGVLGVILLLTVVAPALLATVFRDGVAPIDAGVFVLFLSAAQFSGDFYDSRGVFLLAVLLTARRMATTAHAHAVRSRPKAI